MMNLLIVAALSVVPAPSGGLPTPYDGSPFEPGTAEDEAYVRYLRSTQMFPSEAVCTQHLKDIFQKRADAVELMSNEWVTAPYLAWGGSPERGAVVGPLRSAFSLMESFLTYKTANGEIRKATYACFVQYASQNEVAVWSKGALKYGAYLKEGHQQYITGPAAIFGVAAPGTAVKWNPKIYYYQK